VSSPFLCGPKGIEMDVSSDIKYIEVLLIYRKIFFEISNACKIT